MLIERSETDISRDIRVSRIEQPVTDSLFRAVQPTANSEGVEYFVGAIRLARIRRARVFLRPDMRSDKHRRLMQLVPFRGPRGHPPSAAIEPVRRYRRG